MPSRDQTGVAPVQLVREMYEAAVASGPRVLIDHYTDWFSDDFVWESALLGSLEGGNRRFRGKDEFDAYWGEWEEGWEDVRLGPGSFEAIGEDRVLVTAELHVKGASSGVPFGRTVAYLFEVSDGMVRAGRSFMSPDDARGFLGGA